MSASVKPSGEIEAAVSAATPDLAVVSGIRGVEAAEMNDADLEPYGNTPIRLGVSRLRDLLCTAPAGGRPTMAITDLDARRTFR
jgi:hypothetical protein